MIQFNIILPPTSKSHKLFLPSRLQN